MDADHSQAPASLDQGHRRLAAQERFAAREVLPPLDASGHLDRGALKRVDATTRSRILRSLQRSHGNAVVTRAIGGGGVQRTPALTRVLQRQTPVEIAGLTMGAIALVQSQVNDVQGGLVYESDQLQYPKEQTRVGADLKHVSKPAAKFYAYGVFSDNDTTIMLHGEFSDSNEPATSSLPAATSSATSRPKALVATNRVMSNVYFDLGTTTTYSKSSLSFRARGLATPYGTAADPKLRFVCSGRFDPAGGGDCGYRAVLEVDQHANVKVVEFQMTHGGAYVIKSPTDGFEIRMEHTMYLPDPRYETGDPEEAARIRKWREELRSRSAAKGAAKRRPPGHPGRSPHEVTQGGAPPQPHSLP